MSNGSFIDDLADLPGFSGKGDAIAAAPRDVSKLETEKRGKVIAPKGEFPFDRNSPHFHPCPSCHGTGKFRAYTGRIVGDCFKCKGKGGFMRATQYVDKLAADARKVQHKIDTIAAWKVTNAAEWAWMQAAANRGFNFAGEMINALDKYASLTERQLEATRRFMASDAEHAATRAAEKIARVENAPVVDMSGIIALFAKAIDNDIKRPIFRVEGIEISKAPMNGANAGALYVKSDADVYLGKIINNKFLASREATPETADRLIAIALDPTAEAIKYGRRTGNCSCCGRKLVDPVSIRSGIGPICAGKWGLEFRREWAREDLKAEKIAEGKV